MSEPARIAVLEPDAVSRSSIARILREAGYAPVLFESEISFFQEPSLGQVDCLVVSESLPVLSATQVQLTLNSIACRVPLMVIADSPTIEGTVRAMRAGAIDVLPKPLEPHVLLGAVAHAMTLRARERKIRAQHEAITSRVSCLTAREREVFGHVVAGRLNKQTAALLVISEKTVKVHRARIMEKLEARSLPDLVQLAESMREASLAAAPEARIATWHWDMRHDEVTGNRDFADLFQLGDKAGVGVSLRECLECVHPEDVPQLQVSIDEAIASRKPYQSRYRLLMHRGQESVVVAYGRVRYDVAGVPTLFAGVAVALTRLRRAVS